MAKIILGIDEVGRGPWAGPMVVGACVLGGAVIAGLDDSKKLSAGKREKLAYEIKQRAVAVATGWVSSGEIDQLGLAAALKLAARRAVAKVDEQVRKDQAREDGLNALGGYEQIVIDGTVKLIDDPRVITLPKADALIPAVSAAAIVAKVARDLYMTKLAEKYPEYGFDRHMGYGTQLHRAALEKYGACPEHRRSFRPVAKVLGISPAEQNKIIHTTGRIAEDVAAEYLVDLGHQILARNWKTKSCEIDIVSSHDETIYFTEVKYRKNHRAGGGIDAVDQKKERQMRFAARVFLEFNDLDGKVSAVLSVVSLTGEPPTVEKYIENIDA